MGDKLMTEPCLPIEELLALAQHPKSDPRWSHVDVCPRCRSRLKAYGFFVSLEQEGGCPGEEEAVEQLAAALRDRIQPADSTPRAVPAKRVRWIPRLLVPAVGVAAVVAGVLLLVPGDLLHPGGSTVVREMPSTPPQAVVTPLPARLLSDGSLELRWHAHLQADAYRVRLLDGGLHEIARSAAAAETSLVVTASTLRGWSAPAAVPERAGR